MSKYLLTGGWGFGNLGDDAILLSTISLIYDSDPKAQIGVLSYRKNDTKNLLNLASYKTVDVYESVQHTIFRNEFELQFMERLHTRGQRFVLWWYYKIESVWLKLSRGSLLSDKLIACVFVRLRRIVSKYDFFCMAGGGYINNWRAALITKYIETCIAKQCALRLITFGQSIGPFESDYYKNMAIKILSYYTGTFRDLESYRYLTHTPPINYSAIPDYALYISQGIGYTISKPQNYISKCNMDFQYVLYIVGYDDVQKKKQQLVLYARFVNEMLNCEMLLSVSQCWNTQNTAIELCNFMLAHGIRCRYLFPNNVLELECLISHSVLCLSQNLHALVLSYKNHIPSIALNDRQKFIAFCNLTGIPILPMHAFEAEKAIDLSCKVVGQKICYTDFSSVIKSDFEFLLTL